MQGHLRSRRVEEPFVKSRVPTNSQRSSVGAIERSDKR